MQSVQPLHLTNSNQRLDLVRWHGVYTALPATHTFIHEWNEPFCIHFVSKMASPEQSGAHLNQLILLNLSPPKGWKAELA